jgi:hypothetical protein
MSGFLEDRRVRARQASGKSYAPFPVAGRLAHLAVSFLSALAVCGSPAEVEPASAWEKWISIRTLGGYKDNVLLSASAPDSSPFLGLSLEAIAWRLVGADGEFQAFLVGEHRHFLAASELEREQTLLAHVHYEHHLGLEWTVKAPFEYLYLDQILDVSATEDVVRAARVLGHTISLSPAVQRHWTPGTLELEWVGMRQLYADPLDHSWELGTRVKWEQYFSEWSRGDIAYGFGQAWYDQEPERTASGEPIPGSRRRMQRHDLVLGLVQEWGEAKDWRLTVQASGRYATDLASGYFEYVRPAAGLRIRYRRGPWQFETGVRFRHYHYLTQVAADSGGGLRRRTEVMAEIRGERELLRWLKVFAEIEHERTYANRPSEEYSVNTLSVGLEASF